MARIEFPRSAVKPQVEVKVQKFGCGQCWDQYLLEHPRSTIFHDGRWGRIMRNVYGNESYYLTAIRDGRISGVLQLVHQTSRLFGRHLCSLPYFDAAGVLAQDELSHKALLGAAAELRDSLGDEWVEIRQDQLLGSCLPTRDDKIDLRLALPDSGQKLWKQMDGKVRNQVRKAQREGLVVKMDDGQMLEDFFPIYVAAMRELGSPPHSRQFFAEICSEFPHNVRLCIVRQGENGPVAAAGMALIDQHATRFVWAGCDRKMRSSCANMLLYWSLLEDAAQRKSPYFDFGRSTRDSGTHKFKLQWGAAEHQLYWQYLLPQGAQLPQLRPDSRKYRMLAACWRKLPLGIVTHIGPRVVSKVS